MKPTDGVIDWAKHPVVSAHPLARPWLELTALRGRSAQTLDAYGRDLAAFLKFATEIGVDVTHVIEEHAAMYIAHMRSLPGPQRNCVHLDSRSVLANATVRLFYAWS